MPLYFFHIVDDRGRIADDEGMDLADIEAARAEAKLTAMDLMVQWMKTRVGGDSRTLEIADAGGRVLECKTLRAYAGLN